jgi:hypothetical protein
LDRVFLGHIVDGKSGTVGQRRRAASTGMTGEILSLKNKFCFLKNIYFKFKFKFLYYFYFEFWGFSKNIF